MASSVTKEMPTVINEATPDDTPQGEAGGYTVKVLTNVSSNIQVDCPICLLVLKDPVLVECCGKHFCKTCIEKVSEKKRTCPTCNTQGSKAISDKSHQRTLKELSVRCQNSEVGCKWIGELGKLEDHLNSNPKLENRAKGCGYTKVACMFCKELQYRCNLKTHETEDCKKRPFTCEYCKEYTSQYDDVNINHLPKCGFIPATCPNYCGETPLHQNMKKHVETECPLATIECEFSHVGCEEKTERRNMAAHMRDNLMEHLLLQNRALSKHKYQLESDNNVLRGKMAEMEQKVTQLQVSNRKMAEDLKTLHCEKEALYGRITVLENSQEAVRGHVGLENSAGFIEFKMSHFERHRKQCQSWFSPPFYTYYRGYKLCLKVEPNDMAHSNTHHVSLHLLLMRGEFDDHLKWPFKGDVEIQLVDQTGSDKHCTTVISTQRGRRVTTENRALTGVSEHGFIAHEKLQPNYLKNDCLVFRVYQK